MFEFLQQRTNDLKMKLDFHSILGKKYKNKPQNSNQSSKDKLDESTEKCEKEVILNEKPIKLESTI